MLKCRVCALAESGSRHAGLVRCPVLDDSLPEASPCQVSLQGFRVFIRALKEDVAAYERLKQRETEDWRGLDAWEHDRPLKLERRVVDLNPDFMLGKLMSEIAGNSGRQCASCARWQLDLRRTHCNHCGMLYPRGGHTDE